MYKPLSEAQIKQLQTMTEDLVESRGFFVFSDEIIERAKKAGAIVDYANHLIRLPRQLLRQLLQKVPSNYTVRGCTGDHFQMGAGKQYVSAIVVDPWIIDSLTKKPRRPNLSDVYNNTVLTQSFDSIACVSRMDYPVTDDKGRWSSQKSLLLHLLNHTKHNIAYVSSDDDLELWLEIGNILAQDELLEESGLLSFAVAVRSPLTLTDLNCRILLETTKLKLPVVPTVCPMAGSTSPYDVASTLLQANAECVFLAALTQILEPGTPFIYLMGPSITNMRTGANQYYTMEKTMWKNASVQLAKSYGFPAGAECGGTMDWRCDIQGGAESMLFMQAALNSGADLLTGIGSCFNANGLASEMIVIQQAFLESAKYIREGIDFKNIDRGFNSIVDAGLNDHFMIDDLTLDQLRKKPFFDHPVFDYSGELLDTVEHKASMWDNARSYVAKLVKEYSSPVPKQIRVNLESLFREKFDINL